MLACDTVTAHFRGMTLTVFVHAEGEERLQATLVRLAIHERDILAALDHVMTSVPDESPDADESAKVAFWRSLAVQHVHRDREGHDLPYDGGRREESAAASPSGGSWGPARHRWIYGRHRHQAVCGGPPGGFPSIPKVVFV